jgi:hypothetical protein
MGVEKFTRRARRSGELFGFGEWFCALGVLCCALWRWFRGCFEHKTSVNRLVVVAAGSAMTEMTTEEAVSSCGVGWGMGDETVGRVVGI